MQWAADLVLDAGPDLVAVADRHLRPPTVRPGADQQARVVAVGVDPEAVLEAAEAPLRVVADDRAEGRLDVLLGQDVAETEEVRPPLAEQLIGQAALAELVVERHRLVQDLDVVLAVPEQLVVVGGAERRSAAAKVERGHRRRSGAPSPRQPAGRPARARR